jgi:hypothetical protein
VNHILREFPYMCEIIKDGMVCMMTIEIIHVASIGTSDFITEVFLLLELTDPICWIPDKVHEHPRFILRTLAV